MSRLVNGSRGRVRCGAVGTLLWLSWYSSGRAWGNSSIGAALESKTEHPQRKFDASDQGAYEKRILSDKLDVFVLPKYDDSLKSSNIGNKPRYFRGPVKSKRLPINKK